MIERGLSKASFGNFVKCERVAGGRQSCRVTKLFVIGYRYYYGRVLYHGDLELANGWETNQQEMVLEVTVFMVLFSRIKVGIGIEGLLPVEVLLWEIGNSWSPSGFVVSWDLLLVIPLQEWVTFVLKWFHNLNEPIFYVYVDGSHPLDMASMSYMLLSFPSLLLWCPFETIDYHRTRSNHWDHVWQHESTILLWK